MRFLKLCFVLMLFGISVKAQEKETCFYHVSFYKWEWNYCYGRDTIPLYDLHGKVVKDTIVIDTSNHPRYFILEISDSASFNNWHFEVTSTDSKINYEVKSFEFLWYREKSSHGSIYGTLKSIHCKGVYLNKDALRVLHYLKRYQLFFISDLKIFDPNQQKEILIRRIGFSVE